jgi:hypothetical protein
MPFLRLVGRFRVALNGILPAVIAEMAGLWRNRNRRSSVLNVSICCNDDNGIDTGRVIRVDFDEYELECEDTLWPPRGVRLSFREEAHGTYMRLGRDEWRAIYGIGGGGNIFWRSVMLRRK